MQAGLTARGLHSMGWREEALGKQRIRGNAEAESRKRAAEVWRCRLRAWKVSHVNGTGAQARTMP